MIKTICNLGLTFLWVPTAILLIAGALITVIKFAEDRSWDWHRRVLLSWILVTSPLFLTGLILVSIGIANAKRLS